MNLEDLILENMNNVIGNAEDIVNGRVRQFYDIFRLNPFNHLSDNIFVRSFRLNKQLVINLVRRLDHFLTPPRRPHDLDKQTRVTINKMSLN